MRSLVFGLGSLEQVSGQILQVPIHDFEGVEYPYLSADIVSIYKPDSLHVLCADRVHLSLEEAYLWMT